MFTIQDSYKLRDKTKIGERVVFKTSDGYIIRGNVVRKYDNIFLLNSGKSYQWKEYLIGRDPYFGGMLWC